MTPERKCQTCHQPIRGRTDKRFCSDSCRLNHHQQINHNNAAVRLINQVLMRNRRLLMQFARNGITTVNKDVLHALGFDFNHCTGMHVVQTGAHHFTCYEYTYALTDDGIVHLTSVPSIADRPHVVTQTEYQK